MDIKLIPVEKGSKFTFPALPEKVQGKYAAKYQSFDIISLGTVKVPKGTDVSEFSWDGVFFGASKKNEAIVKTNAWKSPNECNCGVCKENEAESQFIIERRQLYSSLRRYAVGHRLKENGKRHQVDENLRRKQGYDRVHSKETRKEQFGSRPLDMAGRSPDNPGIGGTL